MTGQPGRAQPDPAEPDPASPARHAAPEAESSDSQLLRRYCAGDATAFGILFARHRERLWAVALRTLGDPEEAADALQDAMISAFRRAGDFRGESAVTTWLHRIVVNACLDRMRRRAARPTTGGMDEPTLDALATPAPPNPSLDSDTALDVLDALRTLGPEQRSVLVLVDMLGYSVAETADILGISPGTVKSRCARGRARLLPLLAHLRGGPTGGPGRAPGEDDDPPRAVAADPSPAVPAGEPAAVRRNQPAAPRVSPAEETEDSQR